MAELAEDLLYQGASIDISFAPSRPTFSDLFLICGDKHPNFPPSGKFAFDSLAAFSLSRWTITSEYDL